MYSRRDFGKIVAVGLPLAAFAPTLAFGEINAKVNGVRIGIQSYSLRNLSLDEAIKAMAAIGIGECELFSGHVEPRPQGMGGPGGPGGPPPGAARPPQGAPPAGGAPPQGPRQMTPEMREAMKKRQEETRKWRLTVPMDHFTAIKAKFNAAGIKLQAYNLSFNDSFSDEEIDRGFLMAKALGVKLITASSTLTTAKRVAPFADKHRLMFGGHNHANIKDPNEFAHPRASPRSCPTRSTSG
ncbi:MAG: hypothetical protein AAB401_04340 [Acidobacteriota bacterium]